LNTNASTKRLPPCFIKRISVSRGGISADDLTDVNGATRLGLSPYRSLTLTAPFTSTGQNHSRQIRDFATRDTAVSAPGRQCRKVYSVASAKMGVRNGHTLFGISCIAFAQRRRPSGVNTDSQCRRAPVLLQVRRCAAVSRDLSRRRQAARMPQGT